MKTGLDIDGVLANFPQGFIERAGTLGAGVSFPEDWTKQDTWNFVTDSELFLLASALGVSTEALFPATLKRPKP